MWLRRRNTSQQMYFLSEFYHAVKGDRHYKYLKIMWNFNDDWGRLLKIEASDLDRHYKWDRDLISVRSTKNKEHKWESENSAHWFSHFVLNEHQSSHHLERDDELDCELLPWEGNIGHVELLLKYYGDTYLALET